MSEKQRKFITFCLIVFVLSATYGFVGLSNGVGITVIKPTSPPNNDEVFPELQSIIPHYGYYNYLADALISGNSKLEIQPKSELLKLQNPYNAKENEKFRVQDLSLFNDSYYLYFGIVPSILFLPTKFFNVNISEASAVLIFSLANLLLAACFLHKYCRMNLLPYWKQNIGIVAFALSSGAFTLLRRPAVYEVAIAGGTFFILLASILTAKWITTKKSKYYCLAGIATALAIGCRPIFIIVLVIWGLLGLWHYRRSPTSIIFVALPCTIIFGLLCYYNWLRFNNTLEFGINYQLSSNTITSTGNFRWANIYPIVFSYIITPPELTSFFPFVTPGNLHNYPIQLPIPFYIVEGTIGAIFLSGISLYGICTIWNKDKTGVILFGIGLSILLFLAFAFPAIHMRYQVDFLPLLTLAGILGWISTKGLANYIGIVLISIGLVVSTLWSFTGTHNLFMRAHPGMFRYIDISVPNTKETQILQTVNHNGWRKLSTIPIYFRINSNKPQIMSVNLTPQVSNVRINGVLTNKVALYPGVQWISISSNAPVNLTKVAFIGEDKLIW